MTVNQNCKHLLTIVGPGGTDANDTNVMAVSFGHFWVPEAARETA